jgi:hypothetical protein
LACSARALALASLALALVLAAPARAESKCVAAKLKAVAKYVQSRAGCEAKAYGKGGSADPDCAERAEKKLRRAILKAEGKGDCNDTGDGGGLELLAERFVSDLREKLDPPPLLCCSNGNACTYAADTPECQIRIGGGMLGSEGSVCTGNGACAAPPAAAGPCCQDFFTTRGDPVACASADFDADYCPSGQAIGGSFSANAICRPSGLCVTAE